MHKIEYCGEIYLVVDEEKYDSCDGCCFYNSDNDYNEQCSLKSGTITHFESRCGADPIIYKESLKTVLKRL